MFEAEARERERARLATEAAEQARNSHIFDVSDGSGTAGSLTVTPGTLAFEPRKLSEKNERKKVIIKCSEIRRVEQGQSAYQLPHVNLLLIPIDRKERQIMFYTGTAPSGGIFTPVKPGVNITAEVISAIIEACKMARINK
jgi:hypothetical protein